MKLRTCLRRRRVNEAPLSRRESPRSGSRSIGLRQAMQTTTTTNDRRRLPDLARPRTSHSALRSIQASCAHRLQPKRQHVTMRGSKSLQTIAAQQRLLKRTRRKSARQSQYSERLYERLERNSSSPAPWTASPFRTPSRRHTLDPADPRLLLDDELNALASAAQSRGLQDSPIGFFGHGQGLLYESPSLPSPSQHWRPW